MKLIIDVPNEVLKSRHYCRYFGAWSTKLTETIENGKPYEERPQGEWIKIGDIGLAYTCNKCGEVNVIPTNFCPNCGAKMKGGEK